MLDFGITGRTFWNLIHLVAGALLLHAVFEIAMGLLRNYEPKRVKYGVLVLTVVAWVTVISGTWFVYPGYRAPLPAGASVLNYPKAYLLANNLAFWHDFGMEWKEHVGWLVPMIATGVCFIVYRYAERLRHDLTLRKTVTALIAISFTASLVSGIFGAFISKVAPNDFLKISLISLNFFFS